MGYSVLKDGGIMWEHWQDGKRLKRRLKRSEHAGLGFVSGQSVEQAREVAKHLNAKTRIVADEARRNKLQVRRNADLQSECAFLPPVYIQEFEKQVVEAKALRTDHWHAAKRAILDTNIPPEDWYFRAHDFYTYFAKQGYSPDYSNRIRRLLNEWGRFLCRKTQSFWENIPAPRGKFSNTIRNAYHRKTDGGRYRARLSFSLLQSKRSELTKENYNWLFISVAFGLRPEEIDRSLRTQGRWGIQDKALFIYQYKLERSEPNPKRRWKKIEMVLPEQEEAKKMIMSQVFKAPSRNTLKKLFGSKMTRYGGRKEFFPFMKSLGYDAYKISTWMGHKSLETARRNYDDPADDEFMPKELIKKG